MSKHIPSWALDIYFNSDKLPLLSAIVLDDCCDREENACMIAQLVAEHLKLTK